MRKFILLILCVLAAAQLQAAKISNSFYFNSDFIKNDLSFAAPVTDRLSIGVDGSYLNHDIHNDDIYTFYIPASLSTDLMRIVFRPFFTPKTNELYSYGAMGHLLLTLNNNDNANLYTQALLSISYANQKADIEKNNVIERDNYGQVAYSLGLRQNFYNAFLFGVTANLFQYVNGISNVTAIRSVMDQNSLVDLKTFDIIYDLPKYSIGAMFNRMFLDRNANVYVNYNFIEYYTADSDHSITVGNDFPIAKGWKADIAYNHIRATNHGSKRDIFRVGLSVLF
ncbi:hypothetical protein Emin_0175 [Elusimicrobium minutum Pei191]|uniref:Outer membrane protein beta-barrel domain-containing protein n=1 Tax=Elusimicrobium minutum (strain Pei191) TaxID=445932 RepID=B2KBQ2_ELUMP|nr:hypothetical protein [Elusimicrobium minutum]ACC97739.1 hypothetical protein Emin_0175 [Elusimicrobium minutum Pei191]